MTRKAKVKKWIKRILIVIAVLLGLVWAVYDNLVSNSVYYAQYTPHKEGVEPQLMMVIEHLDDIYLPEMNEYKYDFDGPAAIQFFDNKGQQIGYYSCRKKNEEEYIYHIWRQYTFIFNPKWDIVYLKDYSEQPRHVDTENIDKDRVIEELHVKVQPLIDAQPLPDINLQWLFDWAYHDKFN